VVQGVSGSGALGHGLRPVLRQQLPASVKVHGVISEGGKAPNLIPERAQALFVGKDISDRKSKLKKERKQLVQDRNRVQRRLEKYRNSLAYNF